MNSRIPNSILSSLVHRDSLRMRRELRILKDGVDLCSNDYLGISKQLIVRDGVVARGATGSRLVSGTSEEHQKLEEMLARFHQTESALLFGSGFEANVGLLSSLGSRHDTIVYDDLVHASIRDGVRLSHARSFSFRHNDLDDLRKKLEAARGECFIVVESVYSMDGDTAPLMELCEFAKAHNCYVVVDEAHSTGIFGVQGEGLIQELALQNEVFARVHTFGKALGYRGACVVGSSALREYLINFARPFIYSTAPDLLSVSLIEQAYRLMREAGPQRHALRELIHHFRAEQSKYPGLNFLESHTPIQGVLMKGNEEALCIEAALLANGIHARAIRSPTVPLGEERIRICLHSYNSKEEVTRAVAIVAESSATWRASRHVA